MTTKPLGPSRCQEIVHPAEIWYRSHQCTRKAVKDGYCKQHHPDEVAAREAARRAKHSAQWEVDRLKFAGRKFAQALAKIRDGDNDPRETARKALEGYSDEAIGITRQD